MDGWSPSKTGSYSYAEDTCPQAGGALIAALGDEPTRESNTDIATWTFAAPPGESIASANLWRAGDADGGVEVGAVYEFWFAGPNNLPNPTNAFGQCESGLACPTGRGNLSDPLSSENLVTAPVANLGSRLYVDASCVGPPGYVCAQGQHDAQDYAAVVYLYAADIKLEQTVGPSASNVTGELATAPSVRGPSDVAFDASDPASGVYQAVFSVDGQVVQRTVVDENGGRCVDVGGTGDGLPAFLYVQPCKASVSVDVPFDTTRVSDGVHHLLVTVTDAAGNSAPVLDREIAIANPGTPGPPNGTNASPQATLKVGWGATKKTRLTSRYGRAHTIEGQLTGPGGVAIEGAQIDCTVTPAYAGAKTAVIAHPETGANGRFRMRISGSAGSGTLQFAYREHMGDALPVATESLELTVAAGVRLHVSPHTTSVGRRIFFTGRLLGGPIPRGGKQLVLEARSPGGPWIEFDVVKTNGKGRYHASYRFRFPGPASYFFRAVSESEADYPFARGTSNTVNVHER